MADVKATDIVVRRRTINDNDWSDYKCDVIHKGNTVVFQIKELSDICVMHNRKIIVSIPVEKLTFYYIFLLRVMIH